MSNLNEKIQLGYIKLFRSMKDWEWFTDVNAAHLFVYCLLRANYTTQKWQGKTLKKGSFVTSLSNLADSTGLTIQQVRTSLKKLKSTHEITYTSTQRHTVINVCNYCVFQNEKTNSNTNINTNSNKRITNEQHTDNKRITTDNKRKNIEREYRENFEILIKFAGLKKAKNPVAYADKIMQSSNLEEVIKNCKIELEKAKKLEEKKKKIEQEKIEENLRIQQGCNVSAFSDEKIIEELRKFNEIKTAFKSPIIKDCEKEAKKRGLKI